MGSVLNTTGNRHFNVALPLLLWIFGPVVMFLCYVSMIPILYYIDIVHGEGKVWSKGGVDGGWMRRD